MAEVWRRTRRLMLIAFMENVNKEYERETKELIVLYGPLIFGAMLARGTPEQWDDAFLVRFVDAWKKLTTWAVVGHVEMLYDLSEHAKSYKESNE